MAASAPEQSQSSVDWQTTKQTVRDRTAFLFNNSALMSDIKFVVTDSEHESDDRQVRVPAHKLVLAISSPVFEAMFYGDLAEKGEEIKLPDTESNHLLDFLRFLYCDEVRLTPDNAFGVLYLAEKYIVPSLADKCWSFIDENTCACLKSDTAVSTLNHGMLISLVKRDSLHINKELDLFDAVKNWAEAKCKEEELEPTGEAMRERFGEALNFIRFPIMSREDFAETVVPSGMLTANEALDLHQYFYRVIAPQNIKFPSTLRGIGPDTPLYECQVQRLFRSPEMCHLDDGTVEIINENLEFVVEPIAVFLKNVHLICGDTKTKTQMYSTVVRLLDKTGDEVAVEEGTFSTGEVKMFGNMYGFVVTFTVPVLIRELSKYTLQVNVQGVDGARLQEFDTGSSKSVRANGVSFSFKGNFPHIHQLLFYKLD